MRAGVHMCMCVRAYGCVYVCIGVCSSLYVYAYVNRYTCMSLITTQCDPVHSSSVQRQEGGGVRAQPRNADLSGGTAGGHRESLLRSH